MIGLFSLVWIVRDRESYAVAVKGERGLFGAAPAGLVVVEKKNHGFPPTGQKLGMQF